MVGGLSNSVDHHDWPTTKNALTQSPKQLNLHQNIKNLIFIILFFGNIISSIKSFYIYPDVPMNIPRRSSGHHQTFQWISPDVPVDITRRSTGYHQSFFLISDFLAECLKANKNYKKRSHILQCLTHSKNLNLLDIENNMLPQHSQKPFWLYKSVNTLLSGVRKNICTAPFLDTPELHSLSTLKANVCIFLYTFLTKIFVPET